MLSHVNLDLTTYKCIKRHESRREISRKKEPVEAPSMGDDGGNVNMVKIIIYSTKMSQ